MHIDLEVAGISVPILYEDRSVIALDKPAGWLLAPDSWDRTGRNLQLALQSSLNARDYWAQCRNLKYLRFIHRLDSATSGVTLFARSPGALSALSKLFETRHVEKVYLAVTSAIPNQKEWTCSLPIGQDPHARGRMAVAGPKIRALEPREAETKFRVLDTRGGRALIEARPLTGRTHQIRLHLAAAGVPVMGDELYGQTETNGLPPPVGEGRGQRPTPRATSKNGVPLHAQWKDGLLGLRAWRLSYLDPFEKRPVKIQAPIEDFLKQFGFKTLPPG